MYCKYRVKNKIATCERCGYSHHVRGLPHRICDASKEWPLLGNVVEIGLTRVGVTSAKIVAIKKFFHLKETCDCQRRKYWLNRFDRWVRKRWRAIAGRK